MRIRDRSTCRNSEPPGDSEGPLVAGLPLATNIAISWHMPPVRLACRRSSFRRHANNSERQREPRVKSSFPARVLGSLVLGATLGFPVADLAQAAERAARGHWQTPPRCKIDRSLVDARGPVDVVMQLAGWPLAVANGPDAQRLGGRMSRGQQMALLAEAPS